MYAVRWYARIPHAAQRVVVGDWDDVIAVANMLEQTKVHFKISDVTGIILDQDQTQCGGFRYWLGRDDKFE